MGTAEKEKPHLYYALKYLVGCRYFAAITFQPSEPGRGMGTACRLFYPRR